MELNSSYEAKKKSVLRAFRRKLASKDHPPDRKGRKRTGCEKAVARILNELYLDYEEEHPIWFAGAWKIYDFFVENILLIEVDGVYWHGKMDETGVGELPKVNKHFQLENKRNDILKTFLAKNRGFAFLRVWEDDVFNFPDEVAQKIMYEIDEFKTRGFENE